MIVKALALALSAIFVLTGVYCTSTPADLADRFPSGNMSNRLIKQESKRHQVSDFGYLILIVQDRMLQGRNQTLVDVRAECEIGGRPRVFPLFNEPFEVEDIELDRFTLVGEAEIRITYTLKTERNTRLTPAGEIEFLPAPLLSQDFNLQQICQYFRSQQG
jgi:hypothetical protein